MAGAVGRPAGYLVVDNAASTAQVQPLLPAAPGCMAIVTSRRFLGRPAAAVTTLPLDALSADDAACMFVRLVPRAGSEPVAVADVVAACGHLPLAISLVARLLERHRAWSVADLLAETRSRLVHLAIEDLTIAAAFDLSYRHLPPPQQRMLRLLGLHPGTEFEPHAAAALAGTGVEQASAWLQALHADNLLTEIGYHRYAMHDLLHQYARDLAATEPAPNATPRRPACSTSTRRPRLSRIRAVLRGDPNEHPHWTVLRYRCPTSPTTIEETLRLTHDTGDRLGQAHALKSLGAVRRFTGDHKQATTLLSRTLDLHREVGRPPGRGQHPDRVRESGEPDRPARRRRT